MNQRTAWKLDGTRAGMTTALLEATVDVQHPENGLSAIVAHINGQHVTFPEARVLGVSAGESASKTLEPTDYYARGDDVVVTCRVKETPDFGLQIYWRAVRDQPTNSPGIEVIVSAQTELLDSDPTSTVFSSLPPGDVLMMNPEPGQSFKPLAVENGVATAGNGAVLIRPAESAAVSLLEMVHPADDRGFVIKIIDGQLEMRYPVLTERLEKGVIRRSRLRAMFLSREDDVAVAHDLYARFASSPPPLTT